MTRMHADEINVDVDLARRLIAGQFPAHVELPLVPVVSAGTDHCIYRLGEMLAVRFPRIAAAALQAEKDYRFVKPLAPHLTLKVPTPLAVGEPELDYPFWWSICHWLEGENAYVAPPADLSEAAETLAMFVQSMRQAPVDGDGPLGGRGGPLAGRDEQTRTAIAELKGIVDTKAMLRVWEQALELPAWAGAPVLLHGDIHAGNLLVEDGKITGVVDFGCLAVGDPATDLMIAWSMLDENARQIFRDRLGDDEATWLRGRAWALSVAAIALPYYLHSNEMLATLSRRVIGAVLADAEAMHR